MKIVMFGVHRATEVCVQTLLENGCRVLWVQPESNPFRTWIRHDHLSLYEYDAIGGEALLGVVRKFSPDYILAMILGDRIPQTIVRLAKKYGLNIHPAELPDIRTASSWFWPLRLGKTSSALSVHLLEDQWDAGPIVYKHAFELHPFETQATHVAKVVRQTAPCIRALYELMAGDRIRPVPQANGRSYPRVRIRDICIHWEEPAAQIEALIRASNPFLFAVTSYQSYLVEIGEAEVSDIPATLPGAIRLIDGELYASSADYFLRLMVLFCNGCFSGKRFATMFGVKNGDCFIDAKVLPLVQKNLKNTRWEE